MKTIIIILFCLFILVCLIAARKTQSNNFETWLIEVEDRLDCIVMAEDYYFFADIYNCNHLITPEQAIEEFKQYKENCI